MKKFKWLALVIVAVMMLSVLVACNQTKEFTVTYYDGTNVLKTEKVKEGEKATEWTPTKDGYKFEGWFATPNFSFGFDFTKAITEDTSVFSQWSSATQSVDTREYYIVGSGTSPILMANNWGKVFDETTKMTKAADKNEYTYTLDLQVGDQFQFAINESWHNQRGVGYLTSLTLPNSTTVAFSGASTIGDNSAYRLNIKCEYAGNYTFTLTTHPDDDTYETSNPSYTEANKEAFNINSLDTISWVRNGDAQETVEAVVDYYIKGAGITDWKDMYNAATKMTNNNGVYTLSVYLKQGEEFMFTSTNTVGAQVSTGTLYIRAGNLDAASKTYVDGTVSNMTAKASGTYTFSYTAATEVLSVAFDAAAVPAEADYYIDGTFADGVANWSGYCFNETFKLTETAVGSGVFEIKNVALKADSEIIIQAFKKGATERGEWGTEGYNGLGSYNYTYLFGGGEAFSAVGGGNNNIKVLVAGTYNITFDSYSKIMKIESVNQVDDAYIVGNMTGEGGWKVENNYKMTLKDGSYSITVTLEVNNEFGVRVMVGQTTEQKHWAGASAVTGSPAGFDISGSNIKCTVAGTYTITCTVTDGVATITISSSNS